MDELKKKVAYLQGLISGMELDTSTKEGRLFQGIIDVLEEIADNLEDLWTEQGELEYYLESLDHDLGELEDDFYLDDDDFEFDDEDEDLVDGDGYDVDDDDQAYVEVECPKCGDIVYFEADVLDDDDYVEVTCPHCETVVFVNDEEYELYPADEDDDRHDEDKSQPVGPETEDI
ncbi:MAG: AraC family transcriptional regulator [Thermoanaerobacteraceae bacterium]|nr:AraC family transcriptional regulator [Thermoanaerobacteraceae bacterium]